MNALGRVADHVIAEARDPCDGYLELGDGYLELAGSCFDRLECLRVIRRLAIRGIG
jgi:hypothetical protein